MLIRAHDYFVARPKEPLSEIHGYLSASQSVAGISVDVKCSNNADNHTSVVSVRGNTRLTANVRGSTGLMGRVRSQRQKRAGLKGDRLSIRLLAQPRPTRIIVTPRKPRQRGFALCRVASRWKSFRRRVRDPRRESAVAGWPGNCCSGLQDEELYLRHHWSRDSYRIYAL